MGLSKVWSGSGAAIVCGMLVLAGADSLRAEEAIKMESVQNELLKKSLVKTKAQESGEGVTESDLDRVDRKLEAAEQRLLERAGAAPAAAMPKPSFTGGDEAETQALESAPPAAGGIQEKNLIAPAPSAGGQTAQKASLDTEKLNTEVISGPVAAPDRPAAIKIEGVRPAAQPQQPAPAAASNVQLVQKNAGLERQLKDANDKVNALAKELDETRNRLMIAETQVERLSVIIESRGISRGSPAQQQAPARVSAPQRPSGDADLPDDTQVATVIADKVHLRAGPSKENSPLMAVTKGTKLTVEMRSGDWYRVVAPTGRRAWISGDAIAFGLNPRSNFGNTSRVKGFDSALNDIDEGE